MDVGRKQSQKKDSQEDRVMQEEKLSRGRVHKGGGDQGVGAAQVGGRLCFLKLLHTHLSHLTRSGGLLSSQNSAVERHLVVHDHASHHDDDHQQDQ